MDIWQGPIYAYEKTQKSYHLTHFSLVLIFMQKPVICFALENKWLVSTWNPTLGWNSLILKPSGILIC